MNVLERHKIPYVVYMDVPVESKDFKMFWENYYGFLPDPIYFSNDLLSVAFELSENQSSRVTKYSVFKLNWRKVYQYVSRVCVACVGGALFQFCADKFLIGISSTILTSPS